MPEPVIVLDRGGQELPARLGKGESTQTRNAERRLCIGAV